MGAEIEKEGGQARQAVVEHVPMERLKALPVAVALRLQYHYGVEGERFARAPERVETIGLMFPGGASHAELDLRIVSALGAEQDGRPMGFRWRTVDIGSRQVATLQASMSRPPVDLSAMASEEAAMAVIAELARDVGRSVARASGAVGWGRAEDQPGAASVVGGLDHLFQKLESLHDAQELRREIGAEAAPSRAARPAL